MIKLICDSSCGVTREFAKKNDIEIVNLKTTFNDVTKKEGFEDEWNEFFEAIKNSKDFPKTSQPSPEDYLDAIKKQRAKDKNCEILIISLSSALSGSYNAGRIAVTDFNDDKVKIIDSGCSTVSGILLVEEILELINKNATLDEVIKRAEEIKPKITIQFVPLTMEYLKRGGRIGLLSATFANILHIKPLLVFNNGTLKCEKKCLGLNKAMQEQLDFAGKNLKKFFVAYVHESEVLDKFVQKVKEYYGVDSVQTRKVGPVVGAHVGVGAFGLAYIKD